MSWKTALRVLGHLRHELLLRDGRVGHEVSREVADQVPKNQEHQWHGGTRSNGSQGAESYHEIVQAITEPQDPLGIINCCNLSMLGGVVTYEEVHYG